MIDGGSPPYDSARHSIWNLGMVQSHVLDGNTFQGAPITRNTHNNLLEQELRRIQQLARSREVLPCSEPGPNL